MDQLLIHRKESIILDAIDEIDRNGIQSVSTREIAKRQGVSERVIFKYFPRKNDLILAVLDHFSKYDQAIIETVRSKEMKPREAITYFMDSFSAYYENYPAISAITQSYDTLRHDPEFAEKVKCILDGYTEFLLNVIENAKSIGQIGSETDSEMLADIIMGYFSRACLKWRVYGGFSLRESTMNAVHIILDKFGLA
jgi:AcrR family transcriptional regulator